ncbi:HIRAN domain-containing protein [Bradyrhizobium sp.]
MRSFSIVASGHIPGAEAFIKTLQPGIEAVLVREPTNQYDANAIAVWIDGRKVGYVPKAQNKALAAFIDQTGSMLHYSGAMDQVGSVEVQKAIPAKFIRSPNSGYPQVSVSE